jgi:glycerol kinase
MFGLTRGTSKAHICRAALEAVALQSVELLECMEKDAGAKMTELRVDGGASRSDLLMQTQCDFLRREVVRPANVETTAFGAAALAGLATGVWPDCGAFSRQWSEDRRFTPSEGDHEPIRRQWDRAVERTREWESPTGRVEG